MSHNLEGKVALITGAGKNLGRDTALLLAKNGANIAVHYNSPTSKAGAESTAKELSGLGVKSSVFQGDLTKVAEVEKLFKDVKARFGKVDIAINNVGKVLKKPIVDTDEQEYDSMFEINAKQAFFFIKEAGKVLENNGKIVTVVTSLLAAFTGLYSTYAGSKAPVEHFTRAAAKEFQPRGISVTAIAPGPMDTEFFYGQETPEAVAYHKSQSLDGDLTKIENISPTILHLVTDGYWITGQTIFSNGGYTTR